MPSVTWFKPKWGTYTIFLNTGLYFRSQGQIWPCTLLPRAHSPFPWECPTTTPIHGPPRFTASPLSPPAGCVLGLEFISEVGANSFLRRILAPFYFNAPCLFSTRRLLVAPSSSRRVPASSLPLCFSPSTLRSIYRYQWCATSLHFYLSSYLSIYHLRFCLFKTTIHTLTDWFSQHK